MITTINEFKNNLNESTDWKTQLDELLSDGENPDAILLWDTLSDDAKDEYRNHYYEGQIDFSQSGSWEDGKAPTKQETDDDLMYLLDGVSTNESSTDLVNDFTNSYEKVKNALSALKTATSEFSRNAYSISGSSDSLEAKKYSRKIYDNIGGSFGYVLNGEITKYFSSISSDYEKTINGLNTVETTPEVVVPQGADFTKTELEQMVAAIKVDKAGNRFMTYHIGDSYVMINGNSGDSKNAVNRVGVRITFRDVLEFLEDGEPGEVKNWVEKMKQLTGLIFEIKYDGLNVSW